MEFSLNIKHKQWTFKEPVVMGILNISTDSFYDGGKYNTEKKILLQVEKMISDGATIIDIGAVSTRPGAEEISEEKELDSLLRVQNSILGNFPNMFLSVDTYRSHIAKTAIEFGAHMINDISGGTFDKKMLEVIAEYQVPYIMMHIHGTPKNMQQNPQYENVVNDIKLFFQQQLAIFKQLGVTSNIILDPGFGFGKTVEHNYKLLHHLRSFEELNCPLMAGISRKSMINKVLNTNPQNALNGTTILNTIALLNGANILRVHDVKEAAEAIRLVEFYNKTNH